MGRSQGVIDVAVIHWNAEQANERARALRALGYRTRILSSSEKPNLGAIRASPPDLLLIDLSRLPSQGRDIAAYFRRIRATRRVPILFVGGNSSRVAGVRRVIPDAVFGAWDRVEEGIAKAIQNAPSSPIVPAAMAGYSGAPLAKKLGIRENHAVVLVNPPDRFESLLEPLPAGVEFVEDGRGANVAVLFAESAAELVRDFPPLARRLPERAALWMAWPKKSSGVRTDLTGDVVRRAGLDGGWVDYKICAIDGTWSGLCFARKR